MLAIKNYIKNFIVGYFTYSVRQLVSQHVSRAEYKLEWGTCTPIHEEIHEIQLECRQS